MALLDECFNGLLTASIDAHDSEKEKVISETAKEFSEAFVAKLNALQGKRERQAKMDQYDREVQEWRNRRAAYVMDHVPSLLSGFIGEMEYRMLEATAQAESLFQHFNPTPESPFTPVEVDPEAVNTVNEAARVDGAARVVQAILDSGGYGGEINVTVNGRNFKVTAQPV